MTASFAGNIDNAPLVIDVLNGTYNEQWDAFVEHHPDATFFHLSGWRTVLEDILNHKTYYLYAERGGVFEGVLPLARVKSLLFGDALISVPFCVYGGICAASEEVHGILRNKAVEIAQDIGVDYLELRNSGAAEVGWEGNDLYVTFRKKLHPDPEKNLMDIPRKQRAMVRKGIKAGLKSAPDEDVERFFDAYSQSLRNLGTPVLPKKYFAALKDIFGDKCEILTITDNGKLVSSVMSFYFRNQVLPYYGGGGASARIVKGNDFMYWELMRRSAERGVEVFDYGRSKINTGAYHFKKNWGFDPQPLHYSYKLVNAKTLPELNPLNPKYALFIKLWKRLPLAVSRFIGPMIAKSLG